MKFKNFDIEDVLGANDTEQAKQYIGQEGYYADHIEELDNYIKNKSHIGTLCLIDNNFDIYRFVFNKGYFAFFLPLDKVKKTELKKKEVKYRPCRTIEEVDELLSEDSVKHYCFVGSDLCLRYRATPNIIKHVLIVHLEVKSNTNELVFINSYTPSYMFKNFEIKIADDWVPFGVKDEK